MMVRSICRKLILILFVLIALVIILVAGLLAFLTGTEYKPETDQTMDLDFVYSDHNPVVLTFTLQ